MASIDEDEIVRAAIRRTREFLRPAVQSGLFDKDKPDPDMRDIVRAQLKMLDRRLLSPESWAYLDELLANAPRSRGHPRNQRNLLILEAVRRLVVEPDPEFVGPDPLGGRRFKATRGELKPGQEHECACSIVEKALAELGVALKERTIADIVGDYY
jgi:hypothetical protein